MSRLKLAETKRLTYCVILHTHNVPPRYLSGASPAAVAAESKAPAEEKK